MCNYRDEFKCYEHVCCTSQDKVQLDDKGAENICHVRPCSQETYINSELAKKLKTEGTMTTINIETLNGKESQEFEAISNFKVSSSTGTKYID